MAVFKLLLFLPSRFLVGALAVAALGACSAPESVGDTSRAVNTGLAQVNQNAPSTRVIVQFVQSPTPDQQAEVRRIMAKHGVEVLALGEASNDKRWVVQLPGDFPSRNSAPLMSDLELLPFVEFAEPDRMMVPLN